VRDETTRQPVAGAWVGRGSVATEPPTGVDGRYECLGLGAQAMLSARAAGYADLVVQVPHGDGEVELDLVLARGRALTGRIVAADGRGLGTAYVAAIGDQRLGSGSHHTHWRPAVVAVDGRFRIDALATRTGMGGLGNLFQWHLLVRAPGFGTRALVVPLRQLAPGSIDVGDVVLAPEALVEGRLVDAAGAPIARAEVTLAGVGEGHDVLLAPGTNPPSPQYHVGHRRTTSGGDGSYRFAGVAAGSYTVRATQPEKDWSLESAPQAVAVAAVHRVPDLVFDIGLSIAGVVRCARCVTPPSAQDLTLYAEAPGQETRRAELLADGRFRFERLAAAAYEVHAVELPVGFALMPVPGVVAGTEDLVLELVPATTIEGLVVDHAGKPVPRALVHFFVTGASSARTHAADGEGRFRLEVPPGAIGTLGASQPAHMVRQAHEAGVAAGARGIVLRLPAD
jgi:protocatechuate 3,4-dioxygenase beta subunit